MKNEASELFRKCVEAVPEDMRIKVDLSFDISTRIDFLMKKEGLTQKEFAKRMNKTEAEVSRWLSGRHNFTLATLAKISAELQADIIEVRKTLEK